MKDKNLIPKCVILFPENPSLVSNILL